MPPKGRTPSRQPRRRPKVAGHGHARQAISPSEPATGQPIERSVELPVELPAAEPTADQQTRTGGDGTSDSGGGTRRVDAAEPAADDAMAERLPGDTGPTDTGPTDTGPTDTGPTDTGPTDTGPTDTGLTDTGAADRPRAGGPPAHEESEQTARPGRLSGARTSGRGVQPRPKARAGMRQPAATGKHDARKPKPDPRAERAERAAEAAAADRRGWVQVLLLVMVILLFGTLAAVFRGQAERASTGAANNRAVIDTGANTEVIGQVSKAIETVLSYDHTKLDENERAARGVITGKYVDEYNVAFADIHKTAIEQKVVLTTTVLLAGVKQLSADRAEVIATMDLASVRDGAPRNTPGRVRVVANQVDGRWKIAEMTLL